MILILKDLLLRRSSFNLFFFLVSFCFFSSTLFCLAFLVISLLMLFLFLFFVRVFIIVIVSRQRGALDLLLRRFVYDRLSSRGEEKVRDLGHLTVENFTRYEGEPIFNISK